MGAQESSYPYISATASSTLQERGFSKQELSDITSNSPVPITDGDIERQYWLFLRKYPNGTVNKTEFVDEIVRAHGGDSQAFLPSPAFWDSVFLHILSTSATLQSKSSKGIEQQVSASGVLLSFRDFALTFAVLCNSPISEKLRWVFRMFQTTHAPRTKRKYCRNRSKSKNQQTKVEVKPIGLKGRPELSHSQPTSRTHTPERRSAAGPKNGPLDDSQESEFSSSASTSQADDEPFLNRAQVEKLVAYIREYCLSASTTTRPSEVPPSRLSPPLTRSISPSLPPIVEKSSPIIKISAPSPTVHQISSQTTASRLAVRPRPVKASPLSRAIHAKRKPTFNSANPSALRRVSEDAEDALSIHPRTNGHKTPQTALSSSSSSSSMSSSDDEEDEIGDRPNDLASPIGEGIESTSDSRDSSASDDNSNQGSSGGSSSDSDDEITDWKPSPQFTPPSPKSLQRRAVTPTPHQVTTSTTSRRYKGHHRHASSTESPTTDSELLVRSAEVFGAGRRGSEDSGSSSARNSISSSTNEWYSTELLLLRLLELSGGRIYEGDFIAACEADPYLPTVFLKALDRLLHIPLAPELKPFENQVAGHKGAGRGILKHRDMVYKHFSQAEYDLYEALQPMRDRKEAPPFFPQYFGRTQLCLDSDQNLITHYIMLEDLTYGMKKPCICDIKMGRSTSGDAATIVKKTYMTAIDSLSTSANLGFRICGARTYKFPLDDYDVKEKSYGVMLGEKDMGAFFVSFVNNGLHFHYEILALILGQLREIREWFLKQREFKFVGSSLLIIYDAAAFESEPMKSLERLRNMQKKLKNGQRGHRRGLHGSLASLAALTYFTQVSDLVRIKMIDFAHSHVQSKNSPTTMEGLGSATAVAKLGQASAGALDEDYLLGLESLLAILEGTLFPRTGPSISIRKDNKEFLWIQELRKARRAVLVKLQNRTHYTLELVKCQLDTTESQLWRMFPKNSIVPHSRISFGTESDGPFAGTAGSLTYKVIAPVQTSSRSSSSSSSSKKHRTSRSRDGSSRRSSSRSRDSSKLKSTNKVTSAAPETKAAATVGRSTEATLTMLPESPSPSPTRSRSATVGSYSPVGEHSPSTSPPLASSSTSQHSEKSRAKKAHSIPPGSLIELSWENTLSKRTKFDCRLVSSKNTRYGVTYQHKPGKDNSLFSGDFHEVTFIFCDKKRVFQRFSRSSRRLLSQSNVVDATKHTSPPD